MLSLTDFFLQQRHLEELFSYRYLKLKEMNKIALNPLRTHKVATALYC